MVRKLLLAGILVLAMGAPAAFAATSPLAGYTLVQWVFMGPPQFPQPTIEFVYDNGAVQEPFGLPIYHEAGTPGGSAQSQWFAAYSKIDQGWGGWDNPAALLWYAKNVNATWIGQTMLAPGVIYTSHLVQQMNAAHFAPSMVGGWNPPGITSAASTSPSTPPATSSSSGGTTEPSGGTTPPAPSGGNGSVKPSGTTATTPSAPAPTSTTPSAPAAGSTSATPTQPIEPQAVLQGTPSAIYAARSRNDETALGQIPKHKAGTPWGAVAAAAAVVLLAGGTVVLLRRRRLA